MRCSLLIKALLKEALDLLRVCLICLTLLLIPLKSLAATAHGYLGVFGGEVSVDGMDTKKAEPVTYTLGYRLSSFWALQMEYTEAKPFRGMVLNSEKETPCDMEYTTSGAYLMVIHPMGSLLDFNMKYGYVQVDYSFDDPDVTDSAKDRYSFSGKAYGGGFTLKMSSALVFTVDYTQLRDDASQLSAGIELDL